MQSSVMRNKSAACNRRGVSFVEFIGCLVALCVGVVLGSMYLGIDVQALAVDALEKADIAVPELWDSKSSEDTETVEGEISSDDASQFENEETVSDSQEGQVTMADADASPPQNTAVGNQDSLARQEFTADEQRTATRGYWAALNDCLQTETKARTAEIKDPSKWQLFDYLMHRKQCHQTAVEAIEILDSHGVDKRLIAHAEQVLGWQKAGVDLFDRATFLLTDASAGKLTGPLAQSWQSSATQHRMEEKLILNKHAAVASYLEHTYKAQAETSPNQ